MSNIKVKPLVFQRKGKGEKYVAETPFGRYVLHADINEELDCLFWWWAFQSLEDIYGDVNVLFFSDEMPTLWTKEACVDDAQAHWERMVKSLIFEHDSHAHH